MMAALSLVLVLVTVVGVLAARASRTPRPTDELSDRR